jgi:Ca2+-binding EF-hand superfamily protein
MRKVREHELTVLKRVFKECDADNSNTIDTNELLTVLRRLGYHPDLEVIVDATADAGLKKGEDMNFDQLWQFIEVYRAREGFSKIHVSEVQTLFDDADLADCFKDEELDASNVIHMFRKLGLPIHSTQAQRFVATVDIDGSGTIDIQEFLKMLRHFYEHMVSRAGQAYTERARPSTPKVLEGLVPVASPTDLSLAGRRSSEFMSFFDFVSCVTQLRNKTRNDVKSHCGFGDAEFHAIEEQFAEYDEEKKGFLSDKQVQRLLETLVPHLATSAPERPQLLKIMEEATRDVGGIIDLTAFIRLMGKVKDLSESSKIQREVSSEESVDFTPKEINEFRELFLGEGDREFISLSEVQDMLSNIIPMGAKNIKTLAKTFKEAATVTEQDRNEVEFSEFLLLLQRLTEVGFVGIGEQASKGEGESTPGNGSPSRNRYVRLSTSDLIGVCKQMQQKKNVREQNTQRAARRCTTVCSAGLEERSVSPNTNHLAELR